MNISKQDAIYGAILGAVIGTGYWIGKTLWAGGALADVPVPEIGAAAAVGAIAGILAMVMRSK